MRQARFWFLVGGKRVQVTVDVHPGDTAEDLAWLVCGQVVSGFAFLRDARLITGRYLPA